MGNSWLEILEDSLTRKLLGHDAEYAEKIPFIAGVNQRLKFLLQDPLKHLSFSKIGYSALEAFLQANCTGPPLEFDSVPVVIPSIYRNEATALQYEMLKSLSLDGIDAYPLIPRIELFWLAKCVMDNSILAEEGFNGRRARFRVNFWHQKLLPEPSDTLRTSLFKDAEILDTQLSSRLNYGGAAAQEHMVEFLIERANVRIFYGDDTLAREDLVRASKLREFEFALTGALGKRTKYQENDISQLVVLAKSRDIEPEPYSSRRNSRADGGSRKSSMAERSVRSGSLRPLTPGSNGESGVLQPIIAGQPTSKIQPATIPLNDDTLLDNINFKQKTDVDAATEIVTEQSSLPISLAFMDPADQPLLYPMDSIVLLGIASSITNTSPADGLTREETLPYATRVLEGGSSNWSVYSLALLIRSRIEGYRSRTVERGLLQLQALVDQVIAETTGNNLTSRTDGEADVTSSEPTTFLPKPVSEEGASVAERLRFVHQIHPPLRWDLEAELASRWTQMGGLKTALEIYQRLQMHAEVSLCLAATDREAEATSLLRSLLFINPKDSMEDGEIVQLKSPLPAETPRLLCILGEIESQPKFYDLAWKVSNNRYARAQRSLGKFYLKKGDHEAAIQAISLALRITRQDLATWFSLGCIQLEVKDFQGAVESFTTVVQLEDKDAQGWSNLAVALLKLPLESSQPGSAEDQESTKRIDPLQHTREALRALRRASQLKRDDARIWDNYLTVAASIPPNNEDPERGTPWQEVVNAMSQVITLRASREGESSIDLKVFDAIIDHVTELYDYPDGNDDTEEKPRLPFLVRQMLQLVEQVTPLVTSSGHLFQTLSKVSIWRHRPTEALALVEKSWRATLNSPAPVPNELVKATTVLVNAYKELGSLERERTGGLVEKGWKFKSRSAIRSALGRMRGDEDDKEMNDLNALMEGLKTS